jgi:MFS family permease
MKDQQTLKKRLKPLLLGVFLQSFVLWYAIEKPFLSSLGFNKEAMALLTIISSSSYLVTNVPLGVIADRWSRQGMLLVGSACLVLGSGIADLSHSFFSYAIAAIVYGAFFACTQGVYDSIVYDTVLEETGVDTRYTHYYGRLRIVEGIGLALSSLLGGIVAHYVDLRAAYLYTIPAAGLSFVVLLTFREPRLHHKTVMPSLHSHLGQVIRVSLQKGIIAQVVCSLVLITVGIFIMSQLDQLWMLALSLPIVLYGPVNALLLAGGGLSGILANRVKKQGIGPFIILGSIIAASLLLLVHQLVVIVIAQIFFLGGMTILQIILNGRLHMAAASHIRSGVSSLVSTIGTLAYLPIALLFGFISDRYTVFRASWIVVVLVVILSVVSVRLLYVRPTTGQAT